MKTNHQRDFVASPHTDDSICNVRWYGTEKLPLSDRVVSASSTGGKSDTVRSTKGAKKFVHSRTRFHENAATKRLMNEGLDAEDES